MPNDSSLRVLAIDPGYERVGVAVLDKNKSKETLIFSACFKTPATLPHSDRLKLISDYIAQLCETYRPENIAVESLFFAKNQRTALLVAEARGVIINAAMKFSPTVSEYTPLQVKMATTGYGKSDKRQVADMVRRILKLGNEKKIDDEFDAIAVGLTHLSTNPILKRS